MPIADPTAWAEVRTEWELMPEMTITECAARLGVAVPTVSIRSKREGWAKVSVIDATLPSQTSEQLIVSAMRRLVRICETSKDENTAIKAARIILEHTLGRPQAADGLPVPLQAAPGAPGSAPGSLPAPPWLDPGKRLSYHDAQAVSD